MSISFGELIKSYRLEKRLTQDDLAVDLQACREGSNIDRAAISKWETNAAVPNKRNIGLIADYFHVSAEKIQQAVYETNRRRENGSEVVVGNYELLQWSYRPDNCMMKTNITVIKDGKNSLRFNENVNINSRAGVIEGFVSIVPPNLLFYGKGSSPFVECETILINAPRSQTWVRGVVLGVSSDQYTYPSASRAIAKYLGPDDFSSEPKYDTLSNIKKELIIPENYLGYLCKRPSADWPVLTSRDMIND